LPPARDIHLTRRRHLRQPRLDRDSRAAIQSKLSFPRKRESTESAPSLALDSRFRGSDKFEYALNRTSSASSLVRFPGLALLAERSRPPLAGRTVLLGLPRLPEGHTEVLLGRIDSDEGVVGVAGVGHAAGAGDHAAGGLYVVRHHESVEQQRIVAAQEGVEGGIDGGIVEQSRG